MPAHRNPTAINIASGAYKKNPQRAKARENEPVVTDPIGDPPVSFMPNADGFDPQERQRLRAIWLELIDMAAPGVLNRTHRWHLETTCRLKYKERYGVMKTGDTSNLNKYLSQMGMNPAAQSTVSGAGFAPQGKATPVGAFAQRAQSLRAG